MIPVFGFAKTGEHNWQLLRRLDEFDALGLPLVIGVSRKAFLGSLLAERGAATADNRTATTRPLP